MLHISIAAIYTRIVAMAAECKEFGAWLEMFEGRDTVLCDDILLSTKRPTYDEKLPAFEGVPGYIQMTLDMIAEHFEYFAEDHVRIRHINYLITEDMITGKVVRCSYCKEVHSKYYTCGECKSVMCADAESKCAEKCTHTKKYFEEERVLNFMNIQCDICEAVAYDHVGEIWYYNPETDEHGRFTNMYLDDTLWRVVCGKCKDCEECNDVPWKPVKVQAANDAAGIGSMLDWVPILQHKTTFAAVLYNMNTASPRHGQVILRAVDGHGREGWFIYPNMAAPMSLDEVLAAMRANTTGNEIGPDCAIRKLLTAEGYSTEYG